jgi:hypothetical protein
MLFHKIFEKTQNERSVFDDSVFALTHLPEAGISKTGFGQVKIMKEFV